MQGSKRSNRYYRGLERNRFKINRYMKKESSRKIRQTLITEYIPLNYHKKMIHWRDIDRMW